MTHQQLIDHVRLHGPFADVQAAERAVDAVLRTLAATLHPADARRLAAECPAWLASELTKGPGGPKTAQEFLYQLAQSDQVEHRGDLGFAREYASTVLRSLWQLLSKDGQRVLGEGLPADLAELAEPPEPTLPRSKPVHQAQLERTTLARGKPGARHSISESQAGSQHPLSTGRHGYSKRSMSDSKAGSDHPLSEAKPGSRET